MLIYNAMNLLLGIVTYLNGINAIVGKVSWGVQVIQAYNSTTKLAITGGLFSIISLNGT